MHLILEYAAFAEVWSLDGCLCIHKWKKKLKNKKISKAFLHTLIMKTSYRIQEQNGCYAICCYATSIFVNYDKALVQLHVFTIHIDTNIRFW